MARKKLSLKTPEKDQPVSVSDDPVFDEPSNRTPAEASKPPMAGEGDEPEPIESDDASSQTDSNELSSESSEEVLDPREVIARRYEEKTYGIKADDDQPDDTVTDEEKPLPNKPKTETGNQGKAPETIAVRVNGRTLQVDKTKVEAAGGVETYQKQVAANEGLKDLAFQRKKIEQERLALEHEKQAFQLRSQNPPPQGDTGQARPDLPVTGDQRQATQAELVKRHREALLDGDDTAADSLMLELLGATQAPVSAIQPINPEIIENNAAQKAIKLFKQAEDNRDLQAAGRSLVESNPELLTDPRLFQAVDLETNVVASEHPEWSHTQVMEESLTRVKSWMGNPPAPGTQVEDRVAEKRNLSTPRANTGRAKPPPAPRQQTNSEYIAELRKQRGL